MSAKRFARLFGALVVAIACTAAIAEASGGASVKIVLPAHVHSSYNFQLRVNGTFSKSQLTGSGTKKAGLVVLRQPAAVACKSTEQADWTGPTNALRTFAGPEAKSPFTQGALWNGFTFRRLCVYLYSQPVTALSQPKGKLLAKTTAVVPL